MKHIKYFLYGLLVLLVFATIVGIGYLIIVNFEYVAIVLLPMLAILSVYKLGKSFYKEVIQK